MVAPLLGSILSVTDFPLTLNKLYNSHLAALKFAIIVFLTFPVPTSSRHSLRRVS